MSNTWSYTLFTSFRFIAVEDILTLIVRSLDEMRSNADLIIKNSRLAQQDI